ncbi:MAG: MerR family transcriptional regulator [Tepidiformaceae bacterium]
MLIRIGAVSEQTGVSVDVLRSWERRYGLLTPQRTAGGFRLYSDADAARIRTMIALISVGIPAGEAARQVLASGEGVPISSAGRDETPLQEVCAALHDAFRSFDDLALEAAIDLVLSRLDLDTAIRDVFLPALQTLGDDWQAGLVSVAQEHFSVNVFRGRLMGLARGWDRGFGPRALLACPPAEYHDVSLILFGLALRRRGWRVILLGADTPIGEVVRVRTSLAPQITVLFAAIWADHASLVPELSGSANASIALAGTTAGPIAAAAGRRWLSGDPVTEAETLTQEFTASSQPLRPGVNGK